MIKINHFLFKGQLLIFLTSLFFFTLKINAQSENKKSMAGIIYLYDGKLAGTYLYKGISEINSGQLKIKNDSSIFWYNNNKKINQKPFKKVVLRGDETTILKYYGLGYNGDLYLLIQSKKIQPNNENEPLLIRIDEAVKDVIQKIEKDANGGDIFEYQKIK